MNKTKTLVALGILAVAAAVYALREKIAQGYVKAQTKIFEILLEDDTTDEVTQATAKVPDSDGYPVGNRYAEIPIQQAD